MTAAFDVATVGDNCIDRYSAPILRSCVGGNAVNVAVHLARAGLKVAYFGAVGDDAAGRRTIATLCECGVDTTYVRTVADRPTAYTEITVLPNGDRQFAFEEFGACKGYRPSPDEAAVLTSMRHVHLGWIDDRGALKRLLIDAGVAVSQDLTVNSPDGTVDFSARGLAIAFRSAGETAGNHNTQLAEMLHDGARLAVITRGKSGSIASNGMQAAEAGVQPVEVLETLGAGDTFIAAFIAASLRDQPLDLCLRAGRDAAAVTCTHLGGFPQAPFVDPPEA
ncbi:PfkB family carbohydrate kinase [Aureimonas phyllosphaerae]|uniref:Fructoselysine 6-kinase n=1 Tax=Aureimonas phyllosphaerae TaxID=1166078 RepID=A0A7W6FWI8_9HYPH|nr:PfkB family carbohydrate kinase [Aureimonas phyllosphaerae]MBB3938268.1 fructoselysine 6-kinase [Aureimonas phyllosphaerae]MBB3962275.1 fructoselysine 6-kinase [Aureimonas phyllosphaerae]SFF59092.1 fructoselysine 6-kinase [Aureimonas phyllosphaerae]